MYESRTEADWRSWLDEHAPRFLLFARMKARSEADAQDLVQEALVEAMGRQSCGLPPPVPLVFATIHRRAIDLARREARRTGRELAAMEMTFGVPLEQPDEPGSGSGNAESGVKWFDTSVEDRELQELVQAAMSKLPEIYREVITLRIWGGLSFAEIAATLELPANTAASRYRYGLAELRKLTKGVLA
jgi:RNA polymerase sigma-70 factor, ECF subfamily